MSRWYAVPVALALVGLAAPALAQPAQGRAEVRQEEGHREKASFPMPAEQFRARVQKHQEKIRARVEEHIQKNNVPADKAEEIRAKLNAAINQINAKVDEVCADGTVTKEEAKEVRALAKQLLPHPGKKHEKKGEVG